MDATAAFRSSPIIAAITGTAGESAAKYAVSTSLPLFDAARCSASATPRGPDTRSPVEQAFHREAARLLPGMRCQYPESPYHIDFAWPQYRLAVEIDGHDYHSSQRQREYDNHRGRELTRRGWTVIRFTGSEITRDVATCIEEIRTVIVALMALQGR